LRLGEEVEKLSPMSTWPGDDQKKCAVEMAPLRVEVLGVPGRTQPLCVAVRLRPPDSRIVTQCGYRVDATVRERF